jgi:uncharacterized ion transporter superfamily protein YfcC
MTEDSQTTNTDESPRSAAIERLKNRRSFGQHVVTYVVVNAMLIAIWAATGAGYFWPAWVLGFWGIGLVMHAWTAFLQKPITEDDIEREIRRGGSAAA